MWKTFGAVFSRARVVMIGGCRIQEFAESEGSLVVFSIFNNTVEQMFVTKGTKETMQKQMVITHAI